MTYAIDCINNFIQRYGTGHYYLALHAAFPLALTPDLLYRLRAKFRYDNQNRPLNIPWIAVADLLLSELCHEVGNELYEMDRSIRQQLLKCLKQDPKFSDLRLTELSEFLLTYVQQNLHQPNEPRIKELAQIQRWTALAYTEQKQLARELTLALSQAYLQDRTHLIRLASVAETFAEPLANYEPLLVVYAEAMGKLARGDRSGAAAKFEQLTQGQQQVELAGLTLEFLLTFTFEVVKVNARGREIQREQKQANYFTEDLGNNITLEMVAIPGGTFLMGSPETEKERYKDEDPQHSVTVPSFFMGKYQITQAQWRAVAALPKINRDLESDPSYFKGENLPVENVSWLDAVEFCARLSQKTKREYRLPSEAEWEYACRAGTTTPFHFGETITTDLVNYNGDYKYGSAPKGTYRGKTTPVGSFGVANNFGLYDMHGNVWEWCADDWHNNYEGAPTDGSAWLDLDNNDNHYRLLRGGSWRIGPRLCRSAYRLRYVAGFRNYGIGFRVACSVAWTL